MTRRPGGAPRPGGGRSLRRDRRGVAAIEAALCIPIVLLALLGTVEVSLFFRTQNAMSYAASTAARYASKHSSASSADIQASILAIATSQLQAAGVSGSSTVTVSATYPQGKQAGNTVLVSMSYSWSPITNLKIIPAMPINSAATLTIEN